jgi:hypothetical protein
MDIINKKSFERHEEIREIDDGRVYSVMDIIKQISRWILPSSLFTQIGLPRVLLSSHQMKTLTQQCVSTFGSLLLSQGDEIPLFITIGDETVNDFDVEVD